MVRQHYKDTYEFTLSPADTNHSRTPTFTYLSYMAHNTFHYSTPTVYKLHVVP